MTLASIAMLTALDERIVIVSHSQQPGWAMSIVNGHVETLHAPTAETLGAAIRRAWQASQELPSAQDRAWEQDQAAAELGFATLEDMGRAKAVRVGLESSKGKIYVDYYRFDYDGYEGVGDGDEIAESSIRDEASLGQLALDAIKATA